MTTNNDFNIQGDAIETCQYLFMTERPLDMSWSKFIGEESQGIINAFSSLYSELLPDDDEDEEEQKGEEEEPVNFFALKELMKLQYQVLTRPEPCYKAMANMWSNSKQCLMEVMQMALYYDPGLLYETIL